MSGDTSITVTGTFDAQSKEWKDGETLFEIDEIGLSLRYAAAEAKGTRPKRPSQDEAQVQEDAPVQGAAPRMGWRDRVKALNEAAAEAGDSGYADDDPWFGKNAVGAGSGRPAPTAEPTF
jgi:hypothetical protein